MSQQTTPSETTQTPSTNASRQYLPGTAYLIGEVFLLLSAIMAFALAFSVKSPSQSSTDRLTLGYIAAGTALLGELFILIALAKGTEIIFAIVRDAKVTAPVPVPAEQDQEA